MSKTFLFQAIQFIQTDLIQLIQFSVSTDFIHTVLHVAIQFSVSTDSMSKNSSVSNNLV